MNIVTLGTTNHLPDRTMEINYSINKLSLSGTMIVTKGEYTDAFNEKQFDGIELLILKKLQENLDSLIPNKK